jgi:hypothetical protein
MTCTCAWLFAIGVLINRILVPWRQRLWARKGISSQRYQRQPRDVLLERQDQSLDHGDVAMLTDGAEPRLDLLLAAPILEALAPELLPLVADQVLGLGLGLMHDASQEGAHFPGIAAPRS